MNIPDLASNVEKRDGIWVSRNSSDISYPSDANEVYNKIESDSFWFTHRNHVLGEALSKFVTVSKVLADIGGGNGVTSSYLMQLNFETILVEPGIAGILNAKQRGIVNLINSTFQDAGFRENSLSNIGLFDVVEHIEDDVAFLKQIKYVLKSEGLVFITVPAYENLWSQNDVNAGHFKRYTINRFKKVAKEAGFVMVYSTYFFSLLPFPIFVFRSLPFRLGLISSNLYRKASKEHKKGLLSGLATWLLKIELFLIQKSVSIPFGSSCLFVLQKDTKRAKNTV